LALTPHDERHPDAADGVLRWPTSADALYAAIIGIIGEERMKMESGKEESSEAAIDAKAMADLEKALGFKTLIDILQSYVHTAEELALALDGAVEREDWAQAGRLAQDFAGAAGGLGLTAITAAARSLAQGARDGAKDTVLSAAAGEVMSEHRRVSEALRRLYPDLSA
jgi:HPt (histidine-containing phosphotransfer) domain-containing protein